MSVPSKAIADEFIYLFTSVPPNRPTYKRGVLDALCYPNSHLLEFSYQKRYFQTGLLTENLKFSASRGVLVFIDNAAVNNDHRFVPIRLVRIVDVAPKEKASEYLSTTRLHVRIELGDLIPFAANWNSDIRAISERPVPYRSETSKSNSFYVIRGPELFSKGSVLSQRDIWDQVTSEVSKAKSLDNCVFLSTNHLRPFRTDDACALVGYGPEQKAYQLSPNSTYRLDLRVFDPPTSAGTNNLEIVVRSSSDMVSVSQPFATVHGGSEDSSVLIVCKRSIESTLATLVVDVAARNLPLEPVPEHGQSLINVGVVAAKPQYLLSIEPPKSVLVQFLAFIFLGFLLTATSKDFYSDWFCYPAAFALVSKVIGAGFLSWAGFLAFRKLPSGNAG